MAGPLLGALLVIAGTGVASVIVWLAVRQLPPRGGAAPPSFWSVVWKVTASVLAFLLLVSVFLRLFPE